METEIRYNEPSSRACEHEMTASAEQWANRTADQIRTAIEDERERTFALLAELLAQMQRETIPEVVARLPELRGPVGPVGLLASCRSPPSGRPRQSSTKAPSSRTMAAAIKRFATPASRLITKRTGDVLRLLVATPSRSATVGRSRKGRNTRPMTRSRSTAGRSWPCATSPVPVLVRDGNCLLRRESAALPVKEGRRATAVPPVLRVRTRPRLSAGISTARASP
jgi:hypothetical protein